MSGTVPSQCSQCSVQRRDVILHIVDADIFSSITDGKSAIIEIEDELLIKLVRIYPALYNFSSKKYMDSNFKQDIWKKIGE